MLSEIETASDVLRVTDAKDFMGAVFVLGNQFGLVEQGKQVATGLKISPDIKEAARLVDSLRVVSQRITSSKQQVARVLCLLSLTGLLVKVGLENRVDVGDFHTVEIEGSERLP